MPEDDETLSEEDKQEANALVDALNEIPESKKEEALETAKATFLIKKAEEDKEENEKSMSLKVAQNSSVSLKAEGDAQKQSVSLSAGNDKDDILPERSPYIIDDKNDYRISDDWKDFGKLLAEYLLQILQMFVELLKSGAYDNNKSFKYVGAPLVRSVEGVLKSPTMPLRLGYAATRSAIAKRQAKGKEKEMASLEAKGMENLSKEEQQHLEQLKQEATILRKKAAEKWKSAKEFCGSKSLVNVLTRLADERMDALESARAKRVAELDRGSKNREQKSKPKSESKQQKPTESASADASPTEKQSLSASQKSVQASQVKSAPEISEAVKGKWNKVTSELSSLTQTYAYSNLDEHALRPKMLFSNAANADASVKQALQVEQKVLNELEESSQNQSSQPPSKKPRRFID